MTCQHAMGTEASGEEGLVQRRPGAEATGRARTTAGTEVRSSPPLQVVPRIRHDRLLHECLPARVCPCCLLQMPLCFNLPSYKPLRPQWLALSSPWQVRLDDRAERTVFLGLRFQAVK